MIHAHNIGNVIAHLSRSFKFIPYVETPFLEIGFCSQTSVHDLNSFLKVVRKPKCS